MQQYMKHYLNISRRKVSQDDTLPLISLDIVSRKRAMRQILPICKITPGEIDNSEGVTASELVEQLTQDAEGASEFQNGQLTAAKKEGK